MLNRSLGGAWQELQELRVSRGGGAQILGVKLHCSTVLGSLAGTLCDLLHVPGGVQSEEEPFCKRIGEEGSKLLIKTLVSWCGHITSLDDW